MRRRRRAGQWETEFDALGPAARQFHLKLLSMPVKAPRHLGRLLALVRLYGRKEVLAAIGQALEYQTYDAAYVEALVLQQRRRRDLPSPIPLRPKRSELIEDIHLEEPDPARYDRLFGSSNNEEPSSMTSPRDEAFLRDLAELKLHRIAETYQEVLNEAARKGSSIFEVLALLIGEEADCRRQRALERRVHNARLPKRKLLEDYDFNFPEKIPKQAILRLFDCDFVAEHGCAVFIGATGTGKSHLLNALGYTACEKGISVRFARVVDMINALTTAQLNGTLERALRPYTNPSLLLLDELGYLPIDKRGADLLFQVVAARYEVGSIVVSTNRAFRDWGTTFDVDNTLATAMIDRLMHHGEAIVIQGDSYRMKDKGSDEKPT